MKTCANTHVNLQQGLTPGEWDIWILDENKKDQ